MYDEELAATIRALMAMKQRAERAEEALRTIRDSTFRSAVTLRSIADRALVPTHSAADSTAGGGENE